jgi:ribonuclease Z
LPDGYVLQPPAIIPNSARKIAILGDTSDPYRLKDLAIDADVLVHESTNAYISSSNEGREITNADERKRIRARAIANGHSTAEMAGEFAKAIRAKKLIMNHFSAK